MEVVWTILIFALGYGAGRGWFNKLTILIFALGYGVGRGWFNKFFEKAEKKDSKIENK